MLSLVFSFDPRNLSHFCFSKFKFFFKASQLSFSVVKLSFHCSFLATLLLQYSFLLKKYFLHLCGVLLFLKCYRLLALQQFVLYNLLLKQCAHAEAFFHVSLHIAFSLSAFG